MVSGLVGYWLAGRSDGWLSGRIAGCFSYLCLISLSVVEPYV